ncbi:MAG: hypothetical protein HGN29_04755 [Asgard group archaeon]|nr:hypothetical protein [Asgard group archaeon]
MFPHSPQSSVPPDKLVQQLIMQALQAFYIQDYETAVYFLEQIKTNLPRYMYQLNPQNRALCKEIVKMLQDGSLVPDRSESSVAQAAEDTHPGLSGMSSEVDLISEPEISSEDTETFEITIADTPAHSEPREQQYVPPSSEPTPLVEQPSIDQVVDPDDMQQDPTMPTEFISELSSAVNKVRDKKKKKSKGELTGSMDELEDFDF